MTVFGQNDPIALGLGTYGHHHEIQRPRKPRKLQNKWTIQITWRPNEHKMAFFMSHELGTSLGDLKVLPPDPPNGGTGGTQNKSTAAKFKMFCRTMPRQHEQQQFPETKAIDSFTFQDEITGN